MGSGIGVVYIQRGYQHQHPWRNGADRGSMYLSNQRCRQTDDAKIEASSAPETTKPNNCKQPFGSVGQGITPTQARIDYSMILATTPAPTVRPPSRIAKRKPSSIAIGAIKVTTIWMLSPGITISTPSGNSHAPVTSVVRK